MESFKAAIPYLEASNNIGAQALTLAIGEVQIKLKQDGRAVEAFQQALDISEHLLKNASEEDTLTILRHREKLSFITAQAYERLGSLSQSVSTYLAAAADSRKTGNVQLAGAALWSAGHVSNKMGDSEQAIVLLTEAASWLQQNGIVRDWAWVKLELGQAQFVAGKYHHSVETFLPVTLVAEQLGTTDLAAGLYFLGQSYERLSEFEHALMGYRSALRHLRAGEWKDKATVEASTLHNIGVIQRWLSQYEQAIENLRMAAFKYQELNHLSGQGQALTELAEIFSWIAEPAIAVGYYKKTLGIYRTIGDLPRQVETLAALGEAGYLTDEVSLEDGDKYFKQAQQLIEELTGFHPYVRVKDLDRSNPDDIQRIMQEWQGSLPRLKADHRKAAGVLYQRWGRAILTSDLAEAAWMFLHAFKYHSILSPLHLVEKNRELAIELAKDAYFVGEALRRGRAIEDAVSYFRVAEEIANALRTPEVHFVYTGLARAYADQREISKALNYYKKGIEVLDSVQGQQGTEEVKMGVFAGAIYEYRGFVPLLLNAYTRTNEDRYLRESFEYNGRMKAEVFQEMLARAQVTRSSRNEAIQEEVIRRKIAQTHHRLQSSQLEPSEESKLLDQLEDLRDTWRKLEVNVARQDTRRSDMVSLKPITASNVQLALDADAALLEYAVSHEGSILWAITKEQVRAYTLPGASGLQETLEGYLKSLRQPLIGTDELSSHAALGRKLYETLLAPATETIRHKKHLIISPDGPLHYLPFEALIISQANGRPKAITTPASIDYVIKQFEVSYIPSASFLVARRDEWKEKKQNPELPLLAFGDPPYTRSNEADKTEGIAELALRARPFSFGVLK